MNEKRLKWYLDKLKERSNGMYISQYDCRGVTQLPRAGEIPFVPLGDRTEEKERYRNLVKQGLVEEQHCLDEKDKKYIGSRYTITEKGLEKLKELEEKGVEGGLL